MAKTLEVRSNERVSFVGKTGSGKSTLAHKLVMPLQRLIVLDPKSEISKTKWGLKDWSKRNVNAFLDGKPMRLHVPAPINRDWEPYLQVAYDAEDCTVYIDELYGVCPPGREVGEYLAACYTRGRSLNVGVWAATQRPKWVPLFTLSESEWIFQFRLQLETDRKRMQEIIGPMALNPTKHKYGFYIFNADWDSPLYRKGIKI